MVNSMLKNIAEWDPTPISRLLCHTIQVCTVSNQPLPTRLEPLLLAVVSTPGRFTHVANMKSLCDQAGIGSQRDIQLFNGPTPVWLIITYSKD